MTSQTLALFDIDGTLLLSAGGGRAATERAMREVFGTVGALAEYKFAGKTDFYTLVELLKPEGFSESQVADTLPHYSNVLARNMGEILHLYPLTALPGVHDLINILAARSDVLLGILTGNVPQMADIKLRGIGLEPSIFVINVYGTEARIRRELVPIALERAERHTGNTFAPSNVVIVGPPVTVLDNLADTQAVVKLILGNSTGI